MSINSLAGWRCYGAVTAALLFGGGALLHAQDEPAAPRAQAVRSTGKEAKVAKAQPVAAASEPAAKEESASATPTGRFASLSDFGAEDLAYLVLPSTPPIGGIVIVHDRWGVNAQVKAMANILAQMGYIAIAPDLYNGKTAAGENVAESMEAAVAHPAAVKTITAALRLLKESPKLRVDRVGLLGFGMGGGLALETFANVRGAQQRVDAAVFFYPHVKLGEEDIDRLRIPMQVFLAQRDTVLRSDQTRGFQSRLEAADKRAHFTTYDAAHFFADPNSSTYDRPNYATAWGVTTDFLHRELSKPKDESIFDKMGKALPFGGDKDKLDATAPPKTAKPDDGDVELQSTKPIQAKPIQDPNDAR